MKVAIYVRVSMDEMDKDSVRYQEPENQLLPLRAWANSMNWEVFKEYVDRGSGADPSRSQFRQMLNDAMQQKFSSILVWKLDRFSREGISQVFAYIERLKSRGVSIKSLSEGWLDTDKSNPMSEIILAVMSWASSWERQKISDRTKLGILRRRNLGIWKGGRPKGSKDKMRRKKGGYVLARYNPDY